MPCTLSWPNITRGIRLACALACAGIAATASASEYHGQVIFNKLPVPGATVTATQGDKKVIAITDAQGAYSFPDLADGPWKIHIEMLCFAPLDGDVTVGPAVPTVQWELKLLSLAEITAQSNAVQLAADKPAPIAVAPAPTKPGETAAKPKAAEAPAAEQPKSEDNQQANDGLLINGSVNNAATSQFSLAQAFGNQRSGSKALYTGGVSMTLENSALNATPYSITGINTGKPAYNDVTLGLAVGGPIRIPHIMPRGPNFFVTYQWTRNTNDTIGDALLPTATQIGSVPSPSAQALALLKFYTQLPINVANSTSYNYQTTLVNHTHQDALQGRLDKTLGRKDSVYGNLSFQSQRSSSPSIFNFLDTTDVLGLRGNVNWQHRFTTRFFVTLGYTYSRLRTDVMPNFAYKQNVEGNAGINTGYTQNPADWGPPSLTFSSGITSLGDSNSAYNRNQTNQYTASVNWYRRKHNFTFGGDVRRQEYNYDTQPNPRGSFVFTGAAAKTTDFAAFLEGLPDTSAIAYSTAQYGDRDKYLRQSVYDLYANDDWRLLPQLTINAGIRWEYGAPVTETRGYMANILPSANYSTTQIVTGGNFPGSNVVSSSAAGLPSSLLRPDRLGIEPRIGLSWRPIPGSTLVLRANYGVYDDTSVYQATARAMTNQGPIANSLSSAATSCPLSLSTLATTCASTLADTFGVDPNFRVGYTQTWQVSAQRDLPFALQMVATYLGIKGSNGVQQFLPNTYNIVQTQTVPVGFAYRTSTGSSTREAGSFQLRRRLRSGFTATALYTYSKSIDDDSILGGQGGISAGATSQNGQTPTIAQNWLNLNGERSLSTFDQRNLLNATLQYTSGMGLGGGTLMTGWRGRTLKDWTFLETFVVGSGLPETPIYFATVPNTTYSGTIRPSLTGASIYAAPSGLHLNPAAYVAPAAGQWGTAGRDSITGPSQFTFNSSLQRTFRIEKNLSLDIRADATNILNHVTFTGWNTTINSPLFGSAAAANGMRTVQITARLRLQ